MIIIAPLAEGALNQADIDRLTDRADRVEIFRDGFGVPHIYAPTDADAVFGMLYAQAEDDFKRIEQNYLWATGQLASVEGPSALASDVRARLFMTRAEAISAYQSAPPKLRALCDAFADGLNYFLHTHPDIKPRGIDHFEPWMPMYFSEGSIGGDIERIDLKGISDFYLGESASQVGARVDFDVAPFAEPRGSNGIAIAPDQTASGNTLFLINPHTSFYFRGEIHVVSEEGLNAYGAVTWGQFFVYQGFNEKTGWMHTSTRLDFMDDFIEDVTEFDGALWYRYGIEQRPVESLTDSIWVLEAGELVERRITLYRTHHGPITRSEGEYWIATAMNWDPVPALIQSFERTKQTNLEGFLEMLEVKRNSSNNTVYADANGSVAYFHGNFVPRRNPSFNYDLPVPGWNPRTDWQGLHDISELVRVIDPPNGWVQNCNSTPFTSAGAFSPERENYPTYMAPDPENFRGVHAVRLLQAGKEWTLDSLLDLAYDPALPAFEVLFPPLVDALSNRGSSDARLKAVYETIQSWRHLAGADSVAMTIAHFYGLQVLRNEVTVVGRDEKGALESFASTASEEQQIRALNAVLDDLVERYGRWNLPWGEVNRLQRLTGDIVEPHSDDQDSLPVGLASGRWGALASYGSKRFEGTQKLYGYSGNSFVAVVEFGDRVRAKTMLAGGQASDPQSPHFFDQSTRYIERNFKDVAYYREEVERVARVRYQPGGR